MLLKQALKAAKNAIEAHDPETALDYVDEALELDDACYFAYVFRGKAHQLLGNIAAAISAYQRATELEPANLLAWRGYFQAAQSQDNYERFFEVLAALLALQIDQQLPTADAIKDAKNYLNAHSYTTNSELYEAYLRAIAPNTRLGQLAGTSFGKPEDNLRKLIDLLRKNENDRVSRELLRAKMGLPRALTAENKAKLDAVAWAIRRGLSLPSLYDTYLNIAHDDELRAAYEEQFLKYKYELIKVSPEKDALFTDIREMVEGMVVVRTTSVFAWTIYFDWCDVKDLGDLDFDNVVTFIQNFPNEGLGMVLYAFFMSDASPFDRGKLFSKINLPSQKQPEKTADDEEIADSSEDAAILALVKEEDEISRQDIHLTADEVLTMMLKGFEKASSSVLANRIICGYYIHLYEYFEGSSKCREAIRLLADLQRTLGVDLVNSREDILCSLAIIYTHHEAPKNFPRALQLYERILTSNENNIKAKIGKGLILLEQGNLSGAKEIFESVLTKFPDNNQALLELGWCDVQFGEFSKGRGALKTAFDKVPGVDLKSGEKRAKIRWRIAKSYFLEDKNDDEKIKQAYGELINLLKDSKIYAPSYSLLGVLYQDFYADKVRAQKCFYKAFELDVGEILAAKYLVEDLAAKGEWDIAEILCQRVVTSEKSRRVLLSTSYEDTDKSWPYRVLGCSALNKQGDAKAIEWFQTALRLKAMDIECWVGLGEAYYNCGRLEAASKVFLHALDLEGDSWVLKYMLGRVHCEMGEFEKGIAALEESLAAKPKEECILNALYESTIAYTNKLVLGGFYGKMMEMNIKSIELISKAALVNKTSQNLWKSLGDSLRIFLGVQQNIDAFPMKVVAEVFATVNTLPETLENDNLSVEKAVDLFSSGSHVDAISVFVILSAKAAISLLPGKTNKYLRSATLYNLGLSYLEAYNFSGTTSFRDFAIRTLKKAIQLESNNASFWVALGNAYVSLNPQISQHCYIKATSLESRDGDIWTNLAALYLRYGDAELAQEAFSRAQSVAPQQPQSWLGNALTAQALGDEARAASLFTHAYVLSKERTPLAQLLYALSILDKRVRVAGHDERDIETAQEFSTANFAIQRYLKFYPKDETGLKVACMVAERCHNYEVAVQVGERLCTLLEQKYESSESEVVLAEFAKAKTLLSRVYLGLGSYEKAVETAQFTLDIVQDADDDLKLSILSSRVVIGLSFFFNDQFEEALTEIRTILSQNSGSRRLVTLTAQILYAYGTDDTKQAALDQLFTSIEEQGSSLMVVLVLGALSLVDNLEEYFGAIKEELEGLPLTELVGDSFRIVPTLLAELNRRMADAGSRVWQKSAFLFPQDYAVWRPLSSKMALTVASLRDTKITALGLCNAYIADSTLRKVQRGLFLYPGSEGAMKVLLGFD